MGKLTTQCKTCGNVIDYWPSKSKQYCSPPCYWQSKVGVSHNHRTNNGNSPWNKGKTYSNSKLGKRYPQYSGENHWNWKGGLESESHKQRVLFRKSYQSKIFERDNYTCQMCGQTGDLQVDHIKRWTDYPDLRFDLDNCRTLCMSCHYFVTYGRKIPEGVAWGHNFKRRIASLVS